MIVQWTSKARRPWAAQILPFAAECSTECYGIGWELVALAGFCRGGCDLCLLEELVSIKVLRGFDMLNILFITSLFDSVIQKLHSNVHSLKCAVCSSDFALVRGKFHMVIHPKYMISNAHLFNFSFSW